MTNIMEVSRQWATRPPDQRFLTLDELRTSVERRKRESWTAALPAAELRIMPHDGGLGVLATDPTSREERMLTPTHWAFGQLAQAAGAPAAYLRKLPPELAAINAQWGAENMPARDETLVLARSNGHHELRAITSQTYGRIWDLDVVRAIERVNIDGRWQVPAASYATKNPRRATTLYASDRDVFVFLCDPSHPIEVDGETLFRGFIAWNSEVGAATFGITTFLYRYVCDNRIVWGASNVRELRIRHTGGAPERFAYEGARMLQRYSEDSADEVVATVRAAKSLTIAKDDKPDSVVEWLAKRGFTRTEATAAHKAARAEEGQARSLWDIVQGVTAHARTVEHTDERFDLETRAGKLLAAVGGQA